MKAKLKFINEQYNKEVSKVIKNSRMFDKKYYVKNNPDLGLFYKMNPHIHYALFGYKENRDPSEYFSTSFYYDVCPDVLEAGMNPLYHYEVWGMKEKRILRKYIYHINTNNGEATKLNDNITFSTISFSTLVDLLKLMNATLYLEDKIRSIKNEKAVFVFSHEMSLTGAPIALKKMVDSLLNLGYFPIVFSPINGPESLEFYNDGIPVVIYKDIGDNMIIDKFFGLFDFFVVNTQTFFSNKMINKLNGTRFNVLWWIHESKESYYDVVLDLIPNYLFQNIHIYCVSDYSEEVLNSYFDKFHIKRLMYYIEDFQKKDTYIEKEKIQFTLVGTLEPRKGHKILFESLDYLSDEDRERMTIKLAGFCSSSDVFASLNNVESKYSNIVEYLGVLNKEGIKKLYCDTDCLICASLDDPLPIVVTEAWRNGILSICSENIGQKKIIEDRNCALLYHNDDPQELAKCISDVINGRVDKEKMVNNARNAYDELFTKEVFEKNLKAIIKDIKEEKKIIPQVSVIVPTYNGGDQLVNLITTLRNQKNAEVEIVLVNSGSKEDKGILLAEKSNCIIKHIDKKDFSHSYARNLGASIASNEIILFMTQDALPTTDTFIYEFANTFISSNVAAASCMEVPYPEHDLYGKIENYYHMIVYLEYDKNNKITFFKKGKELSFDDKRKLSSISDVCCMTKKEIFNKYKYSGEYAEDLRYGYGLLCSGEGLGFFNSVSVYHSHERKQKYIMDRTIVDRVNLIEIKEKLCGDNTTSEIKTTKQQIIDCIYSVSIVCLLFLNLFSKNKKIVFDEDSYSSLINETLEFTLKDINLLTKEKAEDTINLFNDKIDGTVIEVVKECTNLAKEMNLELVEEIRYTLTQKVVMYIKYSKAQIFNISYDIIETYLLKYMALWIGCYMSSLYFSKSEDEVLSKLVQYTKGVIEGKNI